MTAETQTKPEPNAYNERKPWLENIDDKPMESADSLFTPPKPEPRKEPDTQSATSNEQVTEDNTPEHTSDQDRPEGGIERRYFDLKAHHDKTVSELREEKRRLEEQIKNVNSDQFKMPKSEEELEKFRDENPDLFDTIIAIARKQAQEEDEAVKTKLSEYEKRENEFKMKEAARAVAEAHPDFEQLKIDDGFHEWAERVASKATQDAIYNNPYDAKRAIEAIDLYKLYKEKVGKQQSSNESSRSNDEDAASLVSTRSQDVGNTQKKVWTRDEINKMSIEEYEKHKEEIFAQLRGQR